MSKIRVDKINYYLDIAETVAERGTCLRKNYGCIIVNNDEIDNNNKYAAKRLEISNDIILYDLIKNENSRLERVEGK